MKRLLMGRTLVIVAVICLILGISVAASAAVIYHLDQTKTGTVTITAPPPPTNTTEELKVYSDSTLTTEVTNLDLAYQTAGNATLTVYVSANAGTVNTVITNPDALTITAIPGTASGGAIPIVISVSGGTAGSHSYSIQFKNS